MKKQLYKQLKKHIHPVNLHIGVWVSIAAISATMLHTSADMVHAIYGAQTVLADTGNHTLREAREYETHVGHAQLGFGRRSYIGGA